MTGAERFVREVEIAARLRHPHILTLFDWGEADEFLYYVMYYVMPYVAGELPVNEAARLFREIVDALHHAQAENE